MITIDNFTIETHEGNYENRPLKSALYFNGEKLSVKVSGYVIEKQFELPNYFLLLINWDCPFEEGCEIVVLSKGFKIVGNYSFTPFYHSYLLTSFSELSLDQYKLVFNDSDYFELMVNYPKSRLFSKVVYVNKIHSPSNK